MINDRTGARIGLENLCGIEISRHIDDLARLRITIFREFPYLYEGSMAYEQRYLRQYASHCDNVCVIARNGDTLVGASTAMWLSAADPAFGGCFEAAGWPGERVFYFGESVLLPRFRGCGIGRSFFHHREAHARRCGARFATFCAVVRPDDHPSRPPSFRSLEPFWENLGYRKLPNTIARYAWREVEQAEETDHTMQFWGRAL